MSYDFLTMSLSTPIHLSAGLNRKAVTRINSMPNIGSRPRQGRENHTEQSGTQSQSSARVPLEVGSMVEVVSNSGITVYGAVQWLGVPEGKTDEWAGIELVSDKNVCTVQFSVGFKCVRRLTSHSISRTMT